MPLTVFFSNSLNALAGQFAPAFAERWKDPFEPPTVIVPSVQTANWLRERLLKTRGADAVWTHCFFDRFIQEQRRAFGEESADKPVREITGAPELQLSIMRLLQDMTREQYPWLYGPPGVESAEPVPERVLQLSSSLARLFLEYFSSRTGLAGAWETGKDFFSRGKTPHEKEEEKFQRDLYRQLIDNNEILAIAHELRRLSRQPRNRPGAGSCAPVFLFNVSGLGMAYHEFLSFEATRRDIYAFILNPCAAFWEDVKTIRDQRLERKYSLLKLRECAEVDDQGENPLLSSWGEFGRGVIRLWSERAADYANTEYLEIPAIEEGKEGTILSRLQQAVLFRLPGEKPQSGAGPQKSDGSLEVIACKGTLRQFEVLRDWIFDLVQTENSSGEKLLLDDIGVYLPDAAACAVEISLVFGAYPPYHPLHIPWAFEGRRSSLSVYAGAVRAYLALMDGPFTRPQFLDFVANPLVMEKIGVTAADIDAWTGWIANLNIFRGFDGQHRREIDRCERTSHTWRQGTDRLLMGRIAAGPVSLGDSECLPYRDIGTGSDELLCRFIAMVNGLWDDRNALREALQEENGWETAAALLSENLAQWLDPHDGAEAGVRNDFLQALSVPGKKGGLLPSGSRGNGPGLQRLFIGWALSQLPEETTGRAAPGGVLLFRTLKTGNVFPFKVIALVNFGAVDFPGENTPRPLDLRPLRPERDDTGPLERNRHAFLEAIVLAKNGLAVFYPSIDPASGAETAPSSTVLELLSAAGLDLRRFRTETPLCPEEGMRRTGPHVAQNPFPVMDSLSRSLGQEGCGDEIPNHKAPAAALETAPSGQGLGPRRISLNALRRWLEDPFTHCIGQAIGRDDSGETAQTLSDEEPFETTFLDCLSFVRERWDAELGSFAGCTGKEILERLAMPKEKTAALWQEQFDVAYRRRRLACRTPEGIFGTIDRNKLFADATSCLAVLWRELGTLSGSVSAETLRVERSASAGAPAREGLLFPGVPADGQAVLLEGAAQTGFWEGGGNGLKKKLHLFAAAYPKLGEDKKAKYALLPWLTAQAVAAARQEDFTCVIHCIDTAGSAAVTIDIQHNEASAYFASALAEYLGAGALAHLPLQAVESILHYGIAPLERIDKCVIEKWLEEDAGSTHPRYSYKNEHVELLQLPIAGNAAPVIASRYGLLLRACYQGAGEDVTEAPCSET